MVASYPSNADEHAGRSSVEAGLTPKGPRRQVENHDYGAFVRRVLRGCGYSWAEIGSRFGITRQAAHQRWG
jgi:hypothetical protein